MNQTDEAYMKQAIELAKLGEGYVNPNPMVGAVIVRNNQIISTGYHKKFGDRHAERMAIEDCNENVQGATLYVTLEPCCHTGKTPPCTDIIIESRIKRVVVSAIDVNKKVSGKGIKILKSHGIQVDVGVCADEANALNEVFNHATINQRPFITYKYAMTLDGKIATLSGNSKWISGEKARAYVQQLRHKNMGIMVGVNTVLADNPRLDARGENAREITKIIVDSQGKTPLDSQIFNTKGNVIIATTNKISLQTEVGYRHKNAHVIKVDEQNGQVNLNQLMKALYQLGIDSVLLEGGSTLAGSMLRENLIDKLDVFIAPKLLGDGLSPTQGMTLANVQESLHFNIKQQEIMGNDIHVIAYRKEQHVYGNH